MVGIGPESMGKCYKIKILHKYAEFKHFSEMAKTIFLGISNDFKKYFIFFLNICFSPKIFSCNSKIYCYIPHKLIISKYIFLSNSEVSGQYVSHDTRTVLNNGSINTGLWVH